MKDKFGLAIKVTKSMISKAEYDKKEAVRNGNYSRASEKANFASGMSQALANFEVSGVAEQLKKMEELLKFAQSNLSITEPYPDPESEYDRCRICGRRDFNHSPNCKGKEWEKNVKELLDEVGK